MVGYEMAADGKSSESSTSYNFIFKQPGLEAQVSCRKIQYREDIKICILKLYHILNSLLK